METLHLVTATVSATYVALAVAERVFLRFTDNHLTPYAAYFQPWAAIAVTPIFLYCRSKHFWLRNDRVHGTEPGIVYPHRDPVLGTDWLVDMSRALKANQLLEVWDEILHRVGSTFWHQNVGHWQLFTSEPENLKAILSTQFDDWPIGGVRLKATELTLGPHAIFSANGAEWQKGRALIRPTFVRNQIADLECQDRHVERFLSRVPKDGSAVNLQELFYVFTMDSATDFMFGYSTDMLVDPTEETLAFARAFDYSQLVSSYRARLGWIVFFIPDKKFGESITTCRRFIDRYVSKAVGDSKIRERPYIFLNELLNSGASHEHIRDQLMAMIIGGRDTSAGTMSSLFWTLARRPDVVRKLRDEIAVLGGQKPTWQDLKNFKYLNLVLKETLRLWAPVPSNLRLAARDTTLPKGGGPDGQSPLFVPKGTDCRYTFYSLHRRKEIFGEDAEEFRPERWESVRTTWGYLPFSGGPRTCIGQQFALTQMSYLLARVLQTFETIEPADNKPMAQKVSVTTSLVNGCWVKFNTS